MWTCWWQDVEAVPMPDGQLCLFALPPEFCEGEGPEAVQYLKLLCRYITDRKVGVWGLYCLLNLCYSLPLGSHQCVCFFFLYQGVVSGILLVTSNKIFFDPCKTHPLVKEHGCEEYLLSCSVDNLMSVSFFSDISHVHFNTSLQRSAMLRSSWTHAATCRLTLCIWLCVSLGKKEEKSSSSWRSKPAACWSRRRRRFLQSCLVWLWAWPKRFLGRKRRLTAGTWKKLRGSLMGFLATQPPSAAEVKEPPARSTRWKPNHQRLQVRMESWWLLLWLFVPPTSLW